MLSANKYPAGTALATDPAALQAITLGEPAGASSGGSAAPASRAAPAGGVAPAGGAVYADAQSKRGEGLYAEQCAACHAADLSGDVGPALAGADFVGTWKDKSLGELFERISMTMPLTAPGSLTPQQTADVIAYMLSVNRFPAGTSELAADPATLKAVPVGEPPQK
jgi:mono/diheme cytochrome c family protein